MEIKRIQVQEGFLANLDVEFSNGLNVIIGSRGVGKTALIELIRFGLAADSFSKPNLTLPDEPAMGVLRGGQVNITLGSDGRDVIVSRSISDEGPRASEPFRSPIVFSQNEIESVGIDPLGKLRIIDRFREKLDIESKKDSICSEIRSLTSEARNLRESISGIADSIAELGDISDDLRAAKEIQEGYLRTLGDAGASQSKLEKLNQEVRNLASQSSVYESLVGQLSELQQRVQALLAYRPNVAGWPSEAGESALAHQVATLTRSLETAVNQLTAEIGQVSAEARNQLLANTSKRSTVEDETRKIRQQVDSIKIGAGQASQRVSELEEKAGQLNALRTEERNYKERKQQILDRRNVLLTELEGISTKIFESRQNVCQLLNDRLGPSISVSLEQSATHSAYIAAISEALRGSGIHYNQVAPVIARTMLPRELAQSAENNDWAEIARIAKIGEERAQRICAEVRASGVEDIICVESDDLVTMSLLDGTEYKPTERLSMGQRCTVVLSVILEFTSVPILIDQPEDHLDNAFIVDTLISTIRDRKKTEQLVFTTHNANIPVLGEAETVLHLDSDGTRGFKRTIGNIEQPDVVDSVTRIMEGGREAFLRRAEFYQTHPAEANEQS